VRLALVVLEEHAWAAVQLGDDDPLGTVDDEAAVVGHQGHLAHVDLLLLHFADHLVRRRAVLAVVDDHLQACTHGTREGQAPLLALALVEGRPGHAVVEEAHLDELVVRDDGEGRQEGGLQALGLALGRVDVLLQEGLVRVLLHRQQIGNAQHAVALAEALADALALRVAVGGSLRHESSEGVGGAWGSVSALDDWRLEHCIRGSVTGHYPPLADKRWLLQPAPRPNPFSAVGSENFRKSPQV
jgi:hypothetical protein